MASLSPQGKPDHAVEADPDGWGRCQAGREEEEEGQAGGGEWEVGEAGLLDGQGHWPVLGQERYNMRRARIEILGRIFILPLVSV